MLYYCIVLSFIEPKSQTNATSILVLVLVFTADTLLPRVHAAVCIIGIKNVLHSISVLVPTPEKFSCQT